MDWQQRMNRALGYLEDSLEGEIDWTAAAALALCSPFQFRRMFEVIAGMSPADYVRRRRLAAAALELAGEGSADVADLSRRFGYDSPDSFGRAFKREFGISPDDARRPRTRLKTLLPITYWVPIASNPPLDVRIERRGAMTLTGVRRRMTVEDGRQARDIPEFWEENQRSGVVDAMAAAVPAHSTLGVVGVNADADVEQQEFTYLIAIESPQDRSRLPERLYDLRVEAGTWAIFESCGPLPTAMTATIRRIYGEWFTSSGWEHAGGPEIEVYRPGDKRARDYCCEIWMPIVERPPD